MSHPPRKMAPRKLLVATIGLCTVSYIGCGDTSSRPPGNLMAPQPTEAPPGNLMAPPGQPLPTDEPSAEPAPSASATSPTSTGAVVATGAPVVPSASAAPSSSAKPFPRPHGPVGNLMAPVPIPKPHN